MSDQTTVTRGSAPVGATDDGGDARWTGRLQFYAIGVIAAIAVALSITTLAAADSASPAAQIGGDYPAFYGAGRIAADGDWGNLYEFDRQVEAQAGLHPADEGDVAWFFAYPPQVAFAYQPLAALGYHWSYLLHTAAMAMLLLASVLLARPMIPWLEGRVVAAFAIALLFWPMFRAVTGGSNAALTVFLIVAAWRLIHGNAPIAAGLVLAGLLYKPQFALPLIGLFLLAGYWRVAIGGAIGALIFYATGAALQGWIWGAEWLDSASSFGRLDAEVNGHSSISFIGMAENLFGVGASPAVVAAWALAGATAVFLSWLWWRNGETDLSGLLAITVPAILLMSPHAMSQDGAVVVITVAIVMGFSTSRGWMTWFLTVWALGASQILIQQLGFSPGFVMLLIVFGGAWVFVHHPERREMLRGRQSSLA
ncbi:MAG: glycosyltransferase family 87 protein [Acidimicrobiia bacterium]